MKPVLFEVISLTDILLGKYKVIGEVYFYKPKLDKRCAVLVGENNYRCIVPVPKNVELVGEIELRENDRGQLECVVQAEEFKPKGKNAKFMIRVQIYHHPVTHQTMHWKRTLVFRLASGRWRLIEMDGKEIKK